MTSCLRIVPKFSTPSSRAMWFNSLICIACKLGDVERRGDLVALRAAALFTLRFLHFVFSQFDRRGRRLQGGGTGWFGRDSGLRPRHGSIQAIPRREFLPGFLPLVSSWAFFVETLGII
jgi:hypothetical protein